MKKLLAIASLLLISALPVASYGWTVGVDVRNVLDRDTRDVARYPLPGRAVFLHLGWRTGSATGGTP